MNLFRAVASVLGRNDRAREDGAHEDGGRSVATVQPVPSRASTTGVQKSGHRERARGAATRGSSPPREMLQKPSPRPQRPAGSAAAGMVTIRDSVLGEMRRRIAEQGDFIQRQQARIAELENIAFLQSEVIIIKDNIAALSASLDQTIDVLETKADANQIPGKTDPLADFSVLADEIQGSGGNPSGIYELKGGFEQPHFDDTSSDFVETQDEYGGVKISLSHMWERLPERLGKKKEDVSLGIVKLYRKGVLDKLCGNAISARIGGYLGVTQACVTYEMVEVYLAGYVDTLDEQKRQAAEWEAGRETPAASNVVQLRPKGW